MCKALSLDENNPSKYKSLCRDGYKKGDMPYELINGNKVNIYTKNNIDVLSIEERETPRVLGDPVLSKNEISELTNGNRAYYLSTYIDALRYYISINSRERGFNLVTDMAELLAGDYEEVGQIDIISNECCDFILVLAKDGVYYMVDPSWQLDLKDWSYKYTISNFSAKSPKELIEEVKKYNSYLLKGASLTYRKLSGSDYIIEKPLETRKIELITGETVETEYRLGLEVYPYCGTQIPVGLGLPQLTYEQIDELLAAKDYENTANQIKTVADMCCYLYRGKFASQRDKNDSLNVGNIRRDDGFQYTLSGKQLLAVKFANCTACSSLANYLLKGDYEEIGYINMFYEDGDGHAMHYVKNDGIYYLVNEPSQFLLGVEQGETALPKLWIKEFGGDDLPASDDLDELMNALVKSNNPCSADDTVKDMFVYKSDGDYCIKVTNLGGNNNLYTFPDSIEVKTYTNSKFDYGTPKYDYLSQTYMIDFDIPDDRPLIKQNMD